MIFSTLFSWTGTALALGYSAFATWVVFTERTAVPGGGWISLKGMGSYIVTLPVSAPLEWLGGKPDYRKTWDMAVAILLCATIVYAAGAIVEWLVRMAFTGSR